MKHRKKRFILALLALSIGLLTLFSVIQEAEAAVTFSEAQTEEYLKEIKKYQGVPYVWGGTTPDGWDCSGFTSYVYKHVLGITISRTSGEQMKEGTAVDVSDRSKWQIFDLLFWVEDGVTKHVALYIGDGKLMEAPHAGAETSIRDVYTYTNGEKSGKLSQVRRHFKIQNGSGKVKIKKQDSQTSEKLGGAQFKLQQWNGSKYVDSTIEMTETDGVYNSAKKLQITEKNKGKWKVVETKAPANHILDSTPWSKEFVIDPDGEVQTFTYTCKNEPVRGDVDIVKYAKDGDSGKLKALAGAQFTFVHQTTKESITLTTNAEGRASTSGGKMRFGVWKCTESKVPEGFTPISPINVTISGESAKHLSVVPLVFMDDDAKAAIFVEKWDELEDKAIPIAGATFQIQKLNGSDWVTQEMTISNYPKLQKASQFQTDENGSFILPEQLKAGSYRLVEVKAPEGYSIGKPLEFKVTTGYNWDLPLMIRYKDKPYRSILHLEKTDGVTKKPLKGVEFQLRAKEQIKTPLGTILYEAEQLVGETLVTDEAGTASTGELYPGKYVLTETKALEGYTPITPREIEVTEGENPEQDLTEIELEIQNYNTLLDISKQDATTGTEITGATLELYQILESDEKLIETWVSESTPHRINGLMPGNYRLKETICPYEQGYVTAQDVTFTLEATGEVQKVVMKDEKSKVKLSKQTLTEKKELKGAKMELRKADGAIIEKWTSGKTPHYIEGLIPNTEYILKEITAPKGYEIAEEIHFIVKDTREIQKVTMYDKTKKIKKADKPTDLVKKIRRNKKTKSVKTGDRSNINLILAFVLSSCALFGICVRIAHKNKK